MDETKLDVFISKFDQFADTTRGELETIKRGIYGDERNQVKGLIERQTEQDKRISRLEKIHYKVIVWEAIILAALQLIWNFIQDQIL